MEYCQELYNYASKGDTYVLQTIDEQHEEEERDDSILRDEVAKAIYSLKLIIAEKQAGLMKCRSTIEQIFNLRILCEKHKIQQKKLYHIFIDFRKVF